MYRYLVILIVVLVFRGVFLAWYIQQGFVGLGPDEAQYWTWSKALDWGYYSKPPGVAFQIAAGTSLLGDTEWGVRAGALFLGSLLSLSIFFLAVVGGLSFQIAFWSALVMAFSPLGIMGSLFAITDVAMMVAWVIACCLLVRTFTSDQPPPYKLIGLCIAIGAIFKWPIYFLWLVVLLGMALYPKLRSKEMIWGVLISLLGLIPALIWNFQHEWVTFRHVSGNMVHVLHGNVWEFLGTQVALISPVLFVLLVLAWAWIFVDHMPPIVKLGSLSSLIIIGIYVVVACFQKMQGNWSVFAYPLAIPALVWISMRWTRIGVGVSFLFVAAVLAIPMLQLPVKTSPFKHNIGWSKIGEDLKKVGYDPDKYFLFGESYQMASLLSFYAPGQRRAYFFNLEGARHNQFDIWPGMAQEQVGKTGLFVQVDYSGHKDCNEKKTEELKEYFKNVECLGTFSLSNQFPKVVHIWRCEEYQGNEPAIPKKY